jgi:hypothetical protein
MENFVRRSDTTHTYTVTYNDPAVSLGTPGDSIDENDSTYWGGSQGRGDGGCVLDFTSEHSFVQPLTLNQIKYHLYGADGHYGNYDQWGWHRLRVEYQLEGSGSWVEIYNSGQIDGATDTGLVTYTPASPIANVRKVRAHFDGAALGTGGEGGSSLTGRIYEIQALGNFPAGFAEII